MKNLYNNLNFVEVTDLSDSKESHEKYIENIENMIKEDFAEDISHFLPIHVFIPNPTPKK